MNFITIQEFSLQLTNYIIATIKLNFACWYWNWLAETLFPVILTSKSRDFDKQIEFWIVFQRDSIITSTFSKRRNWSEVGNDSLKDYCGQNIRSSVEVWRNQFAFGTRHFAAQLVAGTSEVEQRWSTPKWLDLAANLFDIRKKPCDNREKKIRNKMQS